MDSWKKRKCPPELPTEGGDASNSSENKHTAARTHHVPLGGNGLPGELGGSRDGTRGTDD